MTIFIITGSFVLYIHICCTFDNPLSLHTIHIRHCLKPIIWLKIHLKTPSLSRQPEEGPELCMNSCGATFKSHSLRTAEFTDPPHSPLSRLPTQQSHPVFTYTHNNQSYHIDNWISHQILYIFASDQLGQCLCRSSFSLVSPKLSLSYRLSRL